jgi:hypothetical protein
MSLQVRVPENVGVWLAEPKTQPKIVQDCLASFKLPIVMGED